MVLFLIRCLVSHLLSALGWLQRDEDRNRPFALGVVVGLEGHATA